jgi:hypothetical protein
MFKNKILYLKLIKGGKMKKEESDDEEENFDDIVDDLDLDG